ncbi:glycosyltransferase [Kineococcus sp. T13]|uniref:glycosyltransferase n=1 Tax=Kineococcus vitellinus TaxID=2696565 RepID=UPI0014129CB7|nr:glycosyltransferase [Kineococcus vitellinus]
MKICTHATALDRAGGIEMCTYQLSGSLVQRGHGVTVLFQHDGSLRTEYERAGIRLQGPTSFSLTPRTAVQDVARMAPAALWAAGHRPDVLWLQRFEHIVWGQVVARAARAPLVCHLHHMPNYNKVSLLGRGAAAFIAVSEFMRRTWVRRGLPADQVLTIPNAVPEAEYPFGGDAERVAARRALGVPGDTFIALYYGRISVDKGVSVALEAWESLRLDPGNGHLLLVGDGMGAPPELLERIERLRQDGRCTWLPARSDVSTVLHASDVVLFPSLLPEAFGRVVLEALMSGRRVIASKVGAVPEILAGPLDRFLVPSGDPEALAAALRDVLATGPDRSSEEEYAAWTRDRFPYEQHVAAVEDVLARAAHGSP